jgi:hypothetical protein
MQQSRALPLARDIERLPSVARFLPYVMPCDVAHVGAWWRYRN